MSPFISLQHTVCNRNQHDSIGVRPAVGMGFVRQASGQTAEQANQALARFHN